jgi:hypothetical protein
MFSVPTGLEKTDAAGHAEARKQSRENGDDGLDDEFCSFLFHDVLVFKG